MKMDIVAGSQNDEYSTPIYAITPIIKYIPEITNGRKTIIWCPFDNEKSLYVKSFKNSGYNCVYTHINRGGDFFDLNIECDYIVSNPPYSKKTEILKRLFELNKPFAMLLGVVGLFESKQRFEMFANNKFEIMYFDKRIKYFKDDNEQNPSICPPFSSVYICKNILPQQIVFEKIK